jgi:uncharacterized protein
VPILPMFPLGSVLLPQMVLPLHIFEDRYRALIRDVLAGDGEFGVTLISRGHEVGGGDQRVDVGTVALVREADELDDGRWIVLAVGTRRIRVRRWLPEEPYPRAEVVDLPEPPPEPGTAALLAELEPRLRRSLSMLTELGDEGVPATFTLSDDVARASWQAAIVMPFTPYDSQRILETSSCRERLLLTASLVADLEASFQTIIGAERVLVGDEDGWEPWLPKRKGSINWRFW